MYTNERVIKECERISKESNVFFKVEDDVILLDNSKIKMISQNSAKIKIFFINTEYEIIGRFNGSGFDCESILYSSKLEKPNIADLFDVSVLNTMTNVEILKFLGFKWIKVSLI